MSKFSPTSVSATSPDLPSATSPDYVKSLPILTEGASTINMSSVSSDSELSSTASFFSKHKKTLVKTALFALVLLYIVISYSLLLKQHSVSTTEWTLFWIGAVCASAVTLAIIYTDMQLIGMLYAVPFILILVSTCMAVKNNNSSLVYPALFNVVSIVLISVTHVYIK